MKKHLLSLPEGKQPQLLEEGETPPSKKEEEEEEKEEKGSLVKKPKLDKLIPLNIKNRHPLDAKVRFIEEGHKYVTDTGKTIRTSVSSLKGFVQAPFDRNASIAAKFKYPNEVIRDGKKVIVVGKSVGSRNIPEDYGLTRRECIEKQQRTAPEGTLVHKKAELYCELRLDPAMPLERRMAYFLGPKDATDEEFNTAKQIVEAEMQWIEEGWEIYRTEWSLFYEEFDFAGQADVVLKRMNGAYAEFAVLDWKTTRHSMNTNFGKMQGMGNMFHPVAHLETSNATNYLFQMSFYAYILKKKYGINVVMCRAVGIHKDKRKAEVKTWTKLLLEEVELVIEMWGNFMMFERMLKKWEEDGVTHNGLFPDPREPPFFRNKEIL